MKKTLILTVLLASVSALGFSQNAFTVRNVATWVEAVNGVRNGGNDQEYTITVTGTVSVPASTENTFGSVTGIKVTIEGSGTLSPSANGCLLVIGKDQTVIAKDLTLKGRDTNNVSVVNISGGGTFRMEGNAKVTANKSRGVYVNKQGTLIMQNSASVSGNAGGGVDTYGTFTMQGSASVSGNTGDGVCINTDYYGSSGTFTMQGNTSVSDNTDCGVNIHYGTFTMQGSARVSGNKNSKEGGGVSIHYGTFTMQDSTLVSGNTTANVGGGVYVYGDKGTFTMKDSASVSGNTAASYSGGGVYVSSDGTFTIQDNASVSGNTANFGGGVFVNDGTFTMQGGSVSSNTATISGGGVYSNGTLTLQGSASISGNTAYWGGGVYVTSNGTFAKTGGTISGDDAEQKLKNTAIGGKGHVVYEDKNKSWRNASAGQTMNLDSYGFWLNEEAAATGFQPFFFGVWKRRYTHNNTLTFTATTVKSSSRDVIWKFISVSGDIYTFEANTAAKTKLTLTIKVIDGGYWSDYLEISGDSGNGENNWNGDWYKQ